MTDQLAVIRIEGMHCHKCEEAIRKALSVHPGVHEVEVDFNSRQASVLFDKSSVVVGKLAQSVVAAGYRVIGVNQGSVKPSAANQGTANGGTIEQGSANLKPDVTG